MLEELRPDEEKRIIAGWPWPERVIARLLKDGRAQIFACSHCSLHFGMIIEHIAVTRLGRMALQIADMPTRVKV